MMQQLVLGIQYPLAVQNVVLDKWKSYELDFDFVESLHEAAEKLKENQYVCIAICSDHVHQGDIRAFRRIKNIPIVIISPSCPPAKRTESMQHGAMQYILDVGQQADFQISGKDDLQYYLDLPGKPKPLTIITTKDLYFCLEYRTLEIRGQEIELTAKEFDILALLIINQKQVFTYEMIAEMVWPEDFTLYTRKAIITHVSNLRRKMKIAPDMPDYIKSVHRIGYKFDVQE